MRRSLADGNTTERAFEAGKLTPVIDGAYTLNNARQAFRHFGAGNHQGKIVITISPGLQPIR